MVRFALVLAAAAVAGPASAADREKVTAAIEKAAEFLRKSATAPGFGGTADGIGVAGLTGLGLLEAAVKVDDPAVVAVAELIRAKAAADDRTYNVSIAILFLDRLRDPKDGPLIQLLGIRLYGGLLADGGFSYTCKDRAPPPALAGIDPLSTAPVTATGKPAPKVVDDGFLKPAVPAARVAAVGKLHPVLVPHWLAVRESLKVKGRDAGSGDNSNTQFALIGLWVAGRHGLPLDDAFALIEAHFLASQNPATGGWGYTPGGGEATPAMTCAGLLGLAVGASRRPPPAKPAKGQARLNPAGAGLSFVGQYVRATKGGVRPDGGGGAGNPLYTLWSVERVAMAYGLDTLGDVDWHDWGCAHILPNQQPNGSIKGTYQEEVNTAFGLLFLLRANFVDDLSKQLKGQNQDPGKTELRATQGFNAPPPSTAAPLAPLGGAMDRSKAKPETVPDDPAKVAADLVAVPDFLPRLRAVRDAKGAEYTAGLVLAIPKLPDPKQGQARDALAARLGRMTVKTLKTMLADADPELRLAAARAAGAKGDKAAVTDLIDRVADVAAPVSEAARDSLKSLTAQDFGPRPGADPAAREKAKAAWTKWYVAGGADKK